MQHELTTQQAHVNSLLSYPGNPREGDIGAIAVSLQQNGQYRPIVVNKRNMTILAGNHTWKAAKYLGWETIAVTYVDVDEAQARKIVLADNRHNDLASYNDDVLAELLQQVIATDGIEGLLGTGFDGDDVDNLIGDITKDPQHNADYVDLEESYEVIITCRSETHQIELLERLMDEGLDVRAAIV